MDGGEGEGGNNAQLSASDTTTTAPLGNPANRRWRASRGAIGGLHLVTSLSRAKLESPVALLITSHDGGCLFFFPPGSVYANAIEFLVGGLGPARDTTTHR